MGAIPIRVRSHEASTACNQDLVAKFGNLVGGPVLFGVGKVHAGNIFKVGLLVADLGCASGTIDKDLFAEDEIWTIEDKADDAGHDEDDGEKDAADFEIAEEYKWLDDEAARVTQDDHDAGLNAEQTGGDQKDGGGDGQHPGGSAQISPG